MHTSLHTYSIKDSEVELLALRLVLGPALTDLTVLPSEGGASVHPYLSGRAGGVPVTHTPQTQSEALLTFSSKGNGR